MPKLTQAPEANQANQANQKTARRAAPFPKPPGRGCPRLKVEPLSILHTPPAKEEDRIKNRHRHRLTVVAKAFICECIIAGSTNQQINMLLRQKGYILEGEDDLSEDTLGRVRGLPEAALDPEMLTLEARQVGHNIVSALIIHWVELGDSAFDRLEILLGKGEAPPGMSAKAALRIAVFATEFIMSTFAVGLPERLRAEVESHLGPPGEAAGSGSVPLPSKERTMEYLENILAGAYERVRRSMPQEEERPRETMPPGGFTLPPWSAEEEKAAPAPGGREQASDGGLLGASEGNAL